MQKHDFVRATHAILRTARATRLRFVLKPSRDVPLSIDTCFESVQLLVLEEFSKNTVMSALCALFCTLHALHARYALRV